MSFIKDFKNWFTSKEALEHIDSEERLQFKEGEIWFVKWGTNIGFEIDGKKDFLRPCLIIKKLSNETFYAIPLTSRMKNGTWYYKSFVNNQEGRFIFSQMRMLDSKRLAYDVEKLNKDTFLEIKNAFIDFFST